MGGGDRVASVPGEGSAFAFTIRAGAGAAAAAAPAPVQAPARRRWRRPPPLRVLLAEDNTHQPAI